MKAKTKGASFEDLAAVYLKQKGFEILGRNFKTACGEIDIIAATEGNLVFVEVKARLNDSFGTGLEAITKTKIKRLCQAASQYMAKYRIYNAPARFDAIEISEDSGEIIHIENAFESLLD